MKIKVTQLDEHTREGVAIALKHFAASVFPEQTDVRKKYRNLSTAVRHGELLLCEYVYPDQEEVGSHGL